MKINVKVDNAGLLLRLRNGEKRLAYAVVNSLNNTARRIQAEMRKKVGGDFEVRQKQFIARQVAKIDRTNFANVRRGQAWVEIAVGQAPRLLLSTFEAGGERVPFVGKNIAMPVIGGPARPTIRSRVPKAYRFDSLDFVETTTRSGGRVIVSRRQSIYLVPDVGVFERKDGETRMVYAFVPRMRLDARLEFIKTAFTITRRFFGRELEAETIKAIARG